MALTKKTYELYGMTGQLAVYNGTKARCYHSAAVGGELSPTWHIPINNKLTLELPRKFLRELSQFDYPVVETSGWQSIMQSLEQNANTNSCQAYTSNNRTDVGATCASLVAQLRNVLLKRAGGGKHGSNTVEVQQIKDLFAEMDSDHNGELDKKEFLHGCLNVGIRISPQEINLVWPLFDSDGNGTIDTDELTTFLEDQRTGRRTSTELRGISRQLRKSRIANKSAYSTHLKAIAESVQASMLAIIAKEGITQEELFERLDLDCNTFLDRSEFLGGVRRLGVSLSSDDLDVLWPALSLDADGTVSKHEWGKFLDPKGMESWWSYRMTSDLFTTNVRLAPCELNATDPAAATARGSPRRDSGTSVATIAPKHRKPKTTPAERVLRYASPPAPRARHAKERTGVHAPKPPRAAGGAGRRRHAHENENMDANNQTHGRDGHGTKVKRQEQACLDGKAASLPPPQDSDSPEQDSRTPAPLLPNDPRLALTPPPGLEHWLEPEAAAEAIAAAAARVRGLWVRSHRPAVGPAPPRPRMRRQQSSTLALLAEQVSQPPAVPLALLPIRMVSDDHFADHYFARQVVELPDLGIAVGAAAAKEPVRPTTERAAARAPCRLKTSKSASGRSLPKGVMQGTVQSEREAARREAARRQREEGLERRAKDVCATTPRKLEQLVQPVLSARQHRPGAACVSQRARAGGRKAIAPAPPNRKPPRYQRQQSRARPEFEVVGELGGDRGAFAVRPPSGAPVLEQGSKVHLQQERGTWWLKHERGHQRRMDAHQRDLERQQGRVHETCMEIQSRWIVLEQEREELAAEAEQLRPWQKQWPARPAPSKIWRI
jgi:Ca2+-binding EF-hand superfamily protein